MSPSPSSDARTPVRIWDLPTRLFHWLLVLCVITLVVTGNIGGNWITWHMRIGLTVLALLVFRMLWGFVGGYWSRFVRLMHGPGAVARYLRGQAAPSETAGHNPLGSFSVWAMLLALTAQVASGLMTDDEIAFAGPLVALVSGDTVATASRYHTEVGKLILLALIGLHVAAVAYYGLIKGEPLVRAMVTGDKSLPDDIVPSRDGWLQRMLAIACLGGGVCLAWWVASLGS